METKHEDTGVSRLIKLCFNEIEAMKKMGLERKDILKHMKKTFGIEITPGHFSTSFNRVRLEIKNEKEDEAQLRSQKIAELVNTPELLEKNFSIYQYLTTPAVPIVGRRNMDTSGTQVQDTTVLGKSNSRKSEPDITAQTQETTLDVRAYVENVKSGILPFLRPPMDGKDRRFLIQYFTNSENLSRFKYLESGNRDGWIKSLIEVISDNRKDSKSN